MKASEMHFHVLLFITFININLWTLNSISLILMQLFKMTLGNSPNLKIQVDNTIPVHMFHALQYLLHVPHNLFLS